MPFSPDTKSQMFAACSRFCCLCLKQCGVNIEAAHIVDEHKGGSNDYENGIPVCFDCHTEIGHYTDKHPKGNKFRATELQKRRDDVYRHIADGKHIQNKLPAPVTPSELFSRRPGARGSVQRLLDRILSDGPPPEMASKFGLLDDADRADLVDGLRSKAATTIAAITALGEIASSDVLAPEDSRSILEDVIREIVLVGDVESKVAALRDFDADLWSSADLRVRKAFFVDAIAIVRRDQFKEVNVLVPVLVERHDAVPQESHSAYIRALVEHCSSRSHRGAAAAKRGLRSLPREMATTLAGMIDKRFIANLDHYEVVKSLAMEGIIKAPTGQEAYFADLVALPTAEFFRKHTWGGE